MIFNKLPVLGAYTIELDKKDDERGFFSRFWCEKEFKDLNLDTSIVQINNSLSTKKATLRGLHFQYPPKAETKIVRCINGSIWDVIVDIRLESKTYGKWYGAELSSENRTMMYVPKGFAHGFISLTDNSEIIYLVSEFYSQKNESALRWNDPFHGIKWPIKPEVVSEKDSIVSDWNDLKGIKEHN
tara:strand:+ start:3181 stop:3735 length:555 start_codon:yes stop_codon:yes gene_type:complete